MTQGVILLGYRFLICVVGVVVVVVVAAAAGVGVVVVVVVAAGVVVVVVAVAVAVVQQQQQHCCCCCRCCVRCKSLGKFCDRQFFWWTLPRLRKGSVKKRSCVKVRKGICGEKSNCHWMLLFMT